MTPEQRHMALQRAQTIGDQIGTANLMAISGRRVNLLDEEGNVSMPAGSGYYVEVLVDGNDTYIVRRVFKRKGKRFLHGEVKGVYCDQLGDLAYYASCYRSHSAKEWVKQ